MKVIRLVICCLAICAFSFEQSNAQIFNKILSGAKSAVDKAVNTATATTVSKDTLVGTWSYSKPAIKLSSDNALANIGGNVASSSISEKLAKYYGIIGIKEGSFSIAFTSDGTVSTTIGGKTLSGTYKLSDDCKTLSIGFKSQDKIFSANVELAGDELSLTFGGEKLLSFIQTIIENIPNDTTSTIGSLLKNYSSMTVGFAFKKATSAE